MPPKQIVSPLVPLRAPPGPYLAVAKSPTSVHDVPSYFSVRAEKGGPSQPYIRPAVVVPVPVTLLRPVLQELTSLQDVPS